MGLFFFLTFPLWRWPGACEICMWGESLIEHAKEALSCPSGVDGYYEETQLHLQKLWDQRCGVKIQPCWEPPGLVVRTWSFHCHDLGSARGWGTEILQTAWCGKKKKEIQRCWRSDQWQNPPASWLSATALLFPNVYFTFCVYTQVRTSLLAERKRWCDCVCLQVNPTHRAMLPEAKQETALLPHLLLICPGPHFLALPPGQPLDQPTSLWAGTKRNLVLIPQN